MRELEWLKGYYKFLLIAGMSDDEEVVLKVKQRIAELNNDKREEGDGE